VTHGRAACKQGDGEARVFEPFCGGISLQPSMASLDRVLQELQLRCRELESELERIHSALTALKGPNGAGRGRSRKCGVRVMSAAARRRIVAAQKARWAKLREQGADKGE
jgi:hypothetical protein